MTINDVETVSDQDIEIVPRGNYVWRVRLAFPTLEASEKGMLTRMRAAKRLISQKFGTPVELLELREVLEKAREGDGLAVYISIGRVEVGQGEPTVHLKSVEAPNGTVFEDMVAQLDLYYLDESEHVITVDRVINELSKAGVDIDMCNFDLIAKSVEEVRKNRNFIEGLEIVRGTLPDEGFDAHLEYAFFNEPGEAPNIAEYRSGRKVRKKNVLAEKSPAENGKSPGRNVKGEILPPLKGLDFQLVAGEGAVSLAEGTTIVADRNGLAVMKRTMRRARTSAGERVVTASIEVSVKQLIEVDANDIQDLVLEESVEIKGPLKKGASISTSGEVLIDGDIRPGANVNAGADVTIYGKIESAQVSSDENIFMTSGAKDTTITAGADVTIHGTLENSCVSGRKVRLDLVKGGKIEAGFKAALKHASNDAEGHRTTIKVGRGDLYNKQLEANREVVNTMNSHLTQIQTLFGQDIIVRLGHSSTRKLLFEYLRRLRQRGVVNLSNDLIQSYIKLMEAVKPIQNVITERHDIIEELESRDREERAHRPVVVISENVDDPVVVSINDKTTMIGHSKNGTAITLAADGNMCTYSLPTPSHRIVEFEETETNAPKTKKNGKRRKKKKV
jgi:hypothetical protein